MSTVSQLLRNFLLLSTIFVTSHASPLSPLPDPSRLFIYNGTEPTNSTLSIPSLSAAHYHIPDSKIWLWLKFGFPRHSLNPDHLENLFSIGIDMARKGVDTYGINTPVAHPPNDPRAFYLSLNFIEVSLSGTEFHDLTWGEVWDILAGLAQFMTWQGYPYRTSFMAATYETARLAEGFVREVKGVNGLGQS